MIGILFSCSGCGEHVSVKGSSVGMAFKCPGCGEELEAPEPTVVFFCQSCFRQFAAPDALRGAAFRCPHCDSDLSIPEASTLRCGGCGVGIEMDDECYADYEGKPLRCPECRSPVLVPRRPRIGVPPDETPPPGNQPPGFARKTLRLDEIIAGIPQAERLRDQGRCPFCAGEARQTGETSFVCERCGRLIHTVAPTIRRP